MFQSWFVLALLAGLASAMFNFTGRKSLKGGDNTSFSWLFEVFRLGSFCLLAFWDFYIDFNLINLLILLSLGITEFVSVYVFTKMHSLTELSITSVLTRLRLVWVPILAFIFLGETLYGYQYFGIALIIMGAILTVPPRNFRYDKGVKIALFSSVLIALLSVEMKMGAKIASTPVVMMFVAFPTVFFYPLKMKSARLRIRKVIKEKLKDGFIFSLANTVSMYFLVSAYRVGEVGRVLGVYQGVSLISIPLGIIILKERDRIGWKMVSALIALLGMILLK